MAERLDSFDFVRFVRRRVVCPYPIDEWADGTVWRIWHGEDYDVPVTIMQSRLHYYAGVREMKVRTQSVTDGKRMGIVFRFEPRPQREPTSWR